MRLRKSQNTMEKESEVHTTRRPVAEQAQTLGPECHLPVGTVGMTSNSAKVTVRTLK